MKVSIYSSVKIRMLKIRMLQDVRLPCNGADRLVAAEDVPPLYLLANAADGDTRLDRGWNFSCKEHGTFFSVEDACPMETTFKRGEEISLLHFYAHPILEAGKAEILK